MIEERRTYKETYFWMFILCIVITIFSDHYGVSVKQITDYADGIIKKLLKMQIQLL
jgi:hypothetical protein